MSEQPAARARRSVFLETAPFFIVNDVVATSQYYRDKLGFTIDLTIGNPPSYALVRRNTIRMMFRQALTSLRPAELSNTGTVRNTLDAYIWVSDVDALAEELRAVGGVTIVAPPYDADASRREMMVRDLNGYLICFGRVIDWPR